MTNYSLECSGVILDFLSYMGTIKGKSPKTVSEYFLDLRTFFRYIKKSRGLVDSNIPFEEIKINDVDISLIKTITLTEVYAFLHYTMTDRANSNTTRARKVSSIRAFFKYLTSKAGLLETNPVAELDSPKLKKQLPKYLSLEQSIELLNSIDGENAERNYCIILLFLSCGLRLSELVNINLNDIRENTLRIVGKGNKERIVYLNESCQKAIADYIKVRPKDTKEKNALFVSRIGNRISNKTVQWIVKEALKSIGLEEYSTHKLRHTAATLMYQHGDVDIRTLKDILGHENLNTTEIYTHLSSKQLEKAANASPIANFKRKK